MKNLTLLLSFAIPCISMAQNFQSNLPSENFFSTYSLHHTSFTLLPLLNYQLNSKGSLFNSKNYNRANVDAFLSTMLQNGNSKNYMSYTTQTTYLDIRHKAKKKEIGFGIGLKSAGVFFSKADILSFKGSGDPFGSIPLYSNMDLKTRINGYAAVSYYFSNLRNVNRKYLQNVGWKVELLTGLNAAKGNFSSDELIIRDTNNIQMVINRRGYVARSKSKLYPEELLPFYRNPGLAISFGLKWQLSNKNKFSINVLNLGLIYFSRTHHYLHSGNDTINLVSEKNPFNAYADSLDAYSRDHNEAYYFLPFDLNAFFEHRFDKKHQLNLMANGNPILRNFQLSISLDKKISQFHLIPSIHMINFNTVRTGLGIAQNSKFISVGVNINYLANTIVLYRNTMMEYHRFYDRNNFHTTFYIYYHIIKKTTRQTSRNHRLTRTYILN